MSQLPEISGIEAKVKELRNILRQMDVQHVLDTSRIFWIGSVSRSDRSALLKFLGLADRTDLLRLSRMHHAGGDVIFAVIVGEAASDRNYKLFVFKFHSDSPSGKLDCLLAKRIPYEICVHPQASASRAEIEAVFEEARKETNLWKAFTKRLRFLSRKSKKGRRVRRLELR